MGVHLGSRTRSNESRVLQRSVRASAFPDVALRVREPSVPKPQLWPVPPRVAPVVPISCSPFWVGAGLDNSLPLPLPGIATRHVAIIEREDGYWISPVRAVSPAPTVNG